MREYKKSQRPLKRAASLDGIVSDGRRLGVPIHQTYQPNRGRLTPTLDSALNQLDGFHPLRSGGGTSLGQSPEAAESELLLDQPILLDDDTTRKRKTHRRSKLGPSRARKVIKRSLMVLMAAILVGGAYFSVKLYLTQRNLFRGGGQSPALTQCADVNQLNREGDCRINILLLGIGGKEHSDGPDLSDTILLASIDTLNHKISLLSIPRDLWVRIPGNGSRKVNEAYFHGKEASRSKNPDVQRQSGINYIDKTLEPVLGIPIHYHAVVDFEAFRQVVNAVGGVDLNISEKQVVFERLWDEGTGRNYTLDVKAGRQHFDGTRALFYARSRYTSPRGDFDRTERQRLLLVALKDKILSASTFSNPIKISSLLDSLSGNIYSDFSRSEIGRMHEIVSDIPSKAITSLDLATPPHDLVTTGRVGNISIVRPKEGLFVYDDIQTYIRTNLRDGRLARENATVAVYNATSSTGLARAKADELKSYGYNVTAFASVPTPTNPSTTILVDLSKGSKKYTKHYLEKRFRVVAQTKLPASFNLTLPAGTSFVIILGEDVAARL